MLQIHPNSAQMTPKETASLADNLCEIKKTKQAAVIVKQIIAEAKEKNIELDFPELTLESQQKQNNKKNI